MKKRDAEIAGGGGWLATGIASKPTDGGLLRAHHVYRELVQRTGAETIEGGGGRATVRALLDRPRRLGSRLAAADLLITPRGWPVLRRLVRPTVVDLHDQPVIHLDALGFSPAARERASMQRRFDALVGSFARIIVQTRSFAELSGLAEDTRVIVVSNGADTTHIREEPWPNEPIVSMVSGAAPGRGIELLIEATGLVRSSIPDARLQLGLIATGPVASRPYLDRLRTTVAHEGWITIQEVPYRDISTFLGASRVIAIPHPPHRYWDAIVPIKLFDSMAAGRPVVATPRTETARVLAAHDAGMVAGTDRAEDLAHALAEVLADRERAQRLGAHARRAAVMHYDWRILSRAVAEAVLGPDADADRSDV